MRELFSRKRRTIRFSLFVMALLSLLATMSLSRRTTLVAYAMQDDAVQTVFSNPAAIVCADRVSNGAGTNPGLPPAGVYPSTVTVAGLTGTVSKITVTFAITSTFPDDLDVLLIGPTGARSIVISDAGGSGDHTNLSYTFDQTAATAFPDAGTTPIPVGTYRPGNYIGLATPEPGGQDNFPTPGPGLTSYTADFNVFNGTNPNGVWSLYVVDDQQIDLNSLPGGWSIDITTAGGATHNTYDFTGDTSTDFSVLTLGATGSPITWKVLRNPADPAPNAAFIRIFDYGIV